VRFGIADAIGIKLIKKMLKQVQHDKFRGSARHIKFDWFYVIPTKHENKMYREPTEYRQMSFRGSMTKESLKANRTTITTMQI
jgi:hypothetical protein